LQFTLHQVNPAHGEELADIRARAMKESLEAVGRFDPERVRRRFLDGFEPLCTRAIVASGERVGFLVVRHVENHLLLDHLYIEPRVQGTGLGSAVLRTVIAEARKAKKALRLGVLKQGQVNVFYKKHGFELERVEEWDNYYVLPYSDAY
jgi:ribosomal protein S18 acetylase RimI-like enzyme